MEQGQGPRWAIVGPLLVLGAFCLFRLASYFLAQPTGFAMPELDSVDPAIEGKRSMPTPGLAAGAAVVCGPEDAAIIWLRLPDEAPERHREMVSLTNENGANLEIHPKYQTTRYESFAISRGYAERPRRLTLHLYARRRGIRRDFELPVSALTAPTRRQLPAPPPDPNVTVRHEPRGRFAVEVRSRHADARSVLVRLWKTTYLVPREHPLLELRQGTTKSSFIGEPPVLGGSAADAVELEIYEFGESRADKVIVFSSAHIDPTTVETPKQFDLPEKHSAPFGVELALRSLSVARLMRSTAVKLETLECSISESFLPSSVDRLSGNPIVKLQILSPRAGELGVSVVSIISWINPADHTIQTTPNPLKAGPGDLVVKATVVRRHLLDRRRIVVPVLPEAPTSG